MSSHTTLRWTLLFSATGSRERAVICCPSSLRSTLLSLCSSLSRARDGWPARGGPRRGRRGRHTHGRGLGELDDRLEASGACGRASDHQATAYWYHGPVRQGVRLVLEQPRGYALSLSGALGHDATLSAMS